MRQESESTTLAEVAATARAIGTCMLTTVSEDGPLASRPMKVNAADEDGTFWFFASAASGTVRAISRDPRVALAFSSGTTRIAVTGEAAIVDDQQSR
ncbi:MAG TPA: pyridoxamine 5'-phosphate oxidase family protein, partial [Brevibacterium sp.]|nr:pyridoxamine 5'-phosphate oxidase family protein [Brevibacterium sp.]